MGASKPKNYRYLTQMLLATPRFGNPEDFVILQDVHLLEPSEKAKKSATIEEDLTPCAIVDIEDLC